MPVVSKEQAIALLTKEVEENLRPYDLFEVCNELFPDNAYTAEEAYEDVTPLVARIVGRLNKDLATEEIVDFWNLIFPKHRNVWYDEEEERIHYNEESEPLRAE
jgi:hypothetical protein